MGNEGEAGRGAIFRDIRRYYCEYCGICRSKKSLISSHIMSQHREEIAEKEQNEGDGDGKKPNTCDECGASFLKPAHLKQHMQSHSIEIEVRLDNPQPIDFHLGVKHWIPHTRTPKCERY